MLLKEPLNTINKKLQHKIAEEIEKAQQGKSTKSIPQLQHILTELTSMQQEKGLAVGYPRMIVDSWDDSDELGSELMEFHQLYQRLG